LIDMSLLHEANIAEKFGLRLTMEQLADAICTPSTTVEASSAFPWFTDAEIDNLCEGYNINAAKVRYLRSLGLCVKQKPNGRPLVLRSHAEIVLAGLQQLQANAANEKTTGAKPNREALVGLISNRRLNR
jgi:hypothetical protein